SVLKRNAFYPFKHEPVDIVAIRVLLVIIHTDNVGVILYLCKSQHILLKATNCFLKFLSRGDSRKGILLSAGAPFWDSDMSSLIDMKHFSYTQLSHQLIAMNNLLLRVYQT